MSRLELKVPPDVVWVLVAGLMWFASTKTPRVDLPSPVRIGTMAVLTILGTWLIVSARMALEQAKTTWQPMVPEKASCLVDTGVYSISRNPIYLGMLVVLIGLGVGLASPAALVLAAGFVVYIDRFQIVPEERALAGVLGEAYREYQGRVRRWV